MARSTSRAITLPAPSQMALRGASGNTPPSCEGRYGDAQEGGSYMNGLKQSDA